MLKIRQTLWSHSFLFFILAVVVIIYFPGLDGPLILDDLPNLKPMLLIADGQMTWLEYLKNSGFGWRDRPVSILTFAANFSLTGPDVWYLKTVNLFIHLCCGVIIYWLSCLLLTQPKLNIDARSGRWIAVWVTAAWLLAPLQVSTTLYVVQRMAQLPTLFILLGLLCYVVARTQLTSKPRQAYLLLVMTFLVMYPLAVFSKENGVLLPLLIIVIEFFFFRNKEVTTSINKNTIRNLLFVFFITVFLLIVFIYSGSGFLSAYSFRDFTLYERLLTQSRILCDYVMNLLMIPGGSGMGLFHDDVQKSTGLFSPFTTILAIFFWTTLFAFALYRAGTRTGFVLFGVVFYLAAHSIESSILPLELYFEHRNYLPSFGIFFAIALGVYYLTEKSRIKNPIVCVMVLIILSYSVFTLYRVDIWRSWESILLSSQQQHPDSLRVQRGLSIVYTHRGELTKALLHLSEVERLENGRHKTAVAMKYMMAYCYADRESPEEFYQRLEMQEELPADYYSGTVFLWFVEAIENKHCQNLNIERLLTVFEEQIDYEKTGVRYNNWVQLVLLARLYATQEKWIEARQLVDRALEINPSTKNNYVYNLRDFLKDK